jgi:hypothetical protein
MAAQITAITLENAADVLAGSALVVDALDNRAATHGRSRR